MIQHLSALLAIAIAIAAAYPGAVVAQSTTSASFVLPQGADSLTYTLVADLARGQEGVLGDVRLAAGSSPNLSLRAAFAKTYLAARDPKLFVDVTAVRAAGSTGDLDFGVDVTYSVRPARRLGARSGPSEPTSSVLAQGTFVKLAVDEHGVYQLDKAFLDDLGIDADAPGNVRLYSKGGAMLPERVGDDYPVDLQEVALLEVGNGDGAWDDGERLLFYGEGEDVWRFDDALADFTRVENLYAEQTYYYVTAGGDGLRVRDANAARPTEYSDTHTALARWEEERENLLYYSQQRYGSGQGSGQDWFGQLLGTNRVVRKPEPFELGQIAPGGSGRVRARLAASALTGGTRFTLALNDQTFRSTAIASGTRNNAGSEFANFGSVDESVRLNAGTVSVEVDYPGNMETNPGWLDYVEVTHDVVSRYAGAPLFVQSNRHLAAGDYGFEVSDVPAGAVALDIADPLRPRRAGTVGDGESSLRFGYRLGEGDVPRRFLVFDRAAEHARPTRIGEVANTNLHATTDADMLIVYGEGLGDQARRLADHRRAHNGFAVTVAPMSAVADEFGGGRFDPTAIRAFAQMLHERDADFRHLLLLGDANFDARNLRRPEPTLVPVYQTDNSTNEVGGYPTDDYFGLLDEGEGRRDQSIHPRGGLDIGVGRIPASTVRQATAMVDKIIRYETDPDLLGDWRLRTVFVADDEDSNRHIIDMDRVAEANVGKYPDFNQVKVYVDAYEQVPTPGGVRIPRAAEAITQNMFRGNLVTTYLGHGSPRGWGQERFLNAPDITRWNAENAYPVLVTATCTFTGFDDPESVVAGEQVIFKENGGAVATVSTVRPVFTTANYNLTLATHDVILNDSLASREGLGQLLRRAKNSTGDGANNRKFTLFGDPAMKLAVPELDVVVTQFDSVDVRTSPDTVQVPPLREVAVSGVVNVPGGGLAADFDGEISLSVFDQTKRARTLGQDGGSIVREFDQQGSVLFTGRATVTGGRWTARFMLPKDVSLSRGLGRLSMYASSPDGRDGSGLYDRFQIDGLAAPGVDDDTPPLVEVFLGSESFVDGGITSADPVIVARLSDDTGINVSGAVIGHDLTATLRGNSEGTFVLNEFYQADKDDYKRGVARYPVFELPEGSYELDVRAWDLANNTGTGSTSFVVSDDPSVALRQVLNYPNPFVDATCFQFEHNAAGQQVEVQVDIYTTSGRLVRSLRHEGVAQGFRFGNDDCIAWDGTDAYGQQLARGVYLYKVAMRTGDGERAGESDFERLVVLR